jgi:hypothetical protein
MPVGCVVKLFGCGWIWLWMDLVVLFAFGTFSFWTLRRWDNPSFDGLYLSYETCNTEVYLGLGPCLGLDLNNHLLGGNLFWGCTFCFHFLATED